MVYFTTQKNINNSKPIATIDGTRTIIYIVDNDNDIDNDDECGIDRIRNKIKNRSNNIFKDMRLTNGSFIPYPSDREYYISGPSGSGKSYLASQIISQYIKLNKGNPFYIFSRVRDDRALDRLKPQRLKIDESLYEDPIDIEDFRDSVVLFDDIQTITNKKIATAVANIRDSILEVGRHFDTMIVSTTHNLTDNKNTKLLLLEASNVIIFPKYGDTFHIKRFLKEYVGLNKEKIDRILNTKDSRWVLVHKKAPQYVMTQKEIYLI